MTPTVIVTRPKAQGEGFVEKLKAAWRQPTDVFLSPVIEIAFLPISTGPDAACDAIFTSTNAVAAVANADLQQGMTAWCVGAKTAEAAKKAGFNPFTGPGDAAGLVADIAAVGPKRALMHFRGAHTRVEICQQLRSQGLNCREMIVYDQRPLALSEPAKEQLMARGTVLLPLFSPRSAAILAQQGRFTARLHIVAMSDAVARAAQSLAPQSITIAERSDEEAMLTATIELMKQCASGDM